MAAWKLPPRAKVFEAFTAVADGRVRLIGPGSATVTSSQGDKVYDVTWSEDGRTVNANDNASYWQGYLGYPSIAALMAIGVLLVPESVTGPMAGIDWHSLNARHKRDYDAAIREAFGRLSERGIDTARIIRAADDVMTQLARLELERPPRRQRPPS